MPSLSIVTTMFKSENFIEEFYEKVCLSANKIVGDEFELIFVDDGSPDKSLSIALGICQRDSRVSVVELSRNYGHHKAIVAGLSQATGTNVFLIDCDLEEEPCLLEDFYNELNRYKDMDVVYGITSGRDHTLLNRIFGRIFYWLFNFLSDEVRISPNLCTARLMKIEYVKQLVKHCSHEFFFAPAAELTGYKQVPITIDKTFKKTTSYSFARRFHLFVRSIFASSSTPLFSVFYSGIFLTIVAMTSGLFVVYKKLAYGINIEGWVSTTVISLFTSGISMSFSGVIAIYIYLIFKETKRTPFFTIREVHHGETTDLE